jgi:hypothetical protein
MLAHTLTHSLIHSPISLNSGAGQYCWPMVRQD